ncbi:unnamed protein product [Soboliphyme baturini]|uniref:Fibrillar collagen NC1 domain-containing protein n=1 Tax=Soboliphyme baturini TaxID=241478 RepID=A0A3P8BTM0_9BILA|nr:unnamed protein product [Soboliphyme baturini]
MVLNHVQSAIQNKVLASNWIGEQSKQYIVHKLQKIYSVIGYDNWLTDKAQVDDYYKSLRCDDGDDFLTCFVAAHSFTNQKLLSLLDKDPNPSNVEPRFFAMSPFYIAYRNGLIAPQATFAFPFYGGDMPVAALYSTIGYYLGHEIGHAIDHVGMERNNMDPSKELLSEEGWNHFDNVSNCFIQSGNNVCSSHMENLCLDGANIINELLAQDIGMKAAMAALIHQLQERNATSLPLVSSRLTDMQLFFLYYAQTQCEVMSRFTRRAQFCSKIPPAEEQVLSTLRNVREFSEAFQCPIGSFMRPSESCHFL